MSKPDPRIQLLALCVLCLVAGGVRAAAPGQSEASAPTAAATPLPGVSAAPGRAHTVHFAGAAPVDHYVRLYLQGPGETSYAYFGAPAMNRDWSWGWDGVLPGEGEYKINVDAKTASGVWLYHLDRFALTTTATSEIRTLELQQGVNGYAGTTDCYISDWEDGDESKAFGSLEPRTLRMRKVDRREVLLRFELPGLPANARIQHAFVALYAFLNTNPSGPTYYAYQMLRPWSEDEATWERPLAGETWGEVGAMDVSLDRKSDYLDKLCRPVDDPGNDTCGVIIPGWHQLDITAAVQAWVDGEPNYGVLLRSWDPYWASSAENSLYSSEATQIEFRPRLVLYYTEEHTVPTGTPTTTPQLSPTPAPSATPTRAPVALALPLILVVR